eukprot:3655446-Pleurochrysis_carterae.AAC.1
MLIREERLNEKEGVGSKGCGKDGERIDGGSGEEGGNGGTSELGGGEGLDGGGVAWRHRFRSQTIRVGGRRDGGGGLVGVGFQLGA